MSTAFAGASPIRWAIEDVDDDGDHDLLLLFKTQELNLMMDSVSATVSDVTFDDQPFMGIDDLNIIPPQ